MTAKFTKLVSGWLPKSAREFYLKHVKIMNYAFVCGIIGVIVNYSVYHFMIWLIWEPIAFYIGVGVAALSNYTFTRGPLDHWFFEEAKIVES